MAEPLVEAAGLHTYYGSSHVLRGVDLTIGRGEAIGLMGRNGMGKTTTVRSIMGLLAPRRGTIRFAGHDVTGLASLSAVDRHRAVLDLVRRCAGQVLGHAPGIVPDRDTAFSELGFDSLAAVELRNRLTTATGLDLPATLLFDHPTPTALADLLSLELAPEDSDPDEDRVRSALASVSVERLREAGLLDVLLRLADAAVDSLDPGPDRAELDGMDADALIRMALNADE